MADKKTISYRVKGIDLDLDGKRYSEGSTIELAEEPTGKLAARLEPVDPPKEKKQ
jgi:hypothetical protein